MQHSPPHMCHKPKYGLQRRLVQLGYCTDVHLAMYICCCIICSNGQLLILEGEFTWVEEFACLAEHGVCLIVIGITIH